MANSYLGQFVSVITRDDVRIEGNLTHFNLENSIIILRNAICYGTEGRERNRRSKILACHEIPGCVRFWGRDIKDLELILFPNMNTEEESTDFPPLSRAHQHRPS